MCKILKNYLYDLATDRAKGVLATALKMLLYILSRIYGLGVRFLIFVHRRSIKALGCEVISVGNITIGGTGKTCLVAFIAQHLRAMNRKVALVSRGYKRKKRAHEEQGALRWGDEPYMLIRRFKDIPVIVDSDRLRAGKKALSEYKVDTLILDDAMQQWGIKKDLEIVAINGKTGFGNSQLLPRGILREPLSSLKRADIFVITDPPSAVEVESLKEVFARVNPKALVVVVVHTQRGLLSLDGSGPLLSAAMLENKTVALVCGIGNPDSFRETVRGLGASVGASFVFPDHHYYCRRDIEEIMKQVKQKGIDTVITTEKDAVRLEGFDISEPGVRLLALRVEITFKENEQGFLDRLAQRYVF
jgi:tetraacyldisaccharide 4'-kinase